MKIQIKFTTVTPLCQIVGVDEKKINGKQVKYTAVQKMPMYIMAGDEKVFVKMPVYTANGFRGKLRREATGLLYEKAIEKGLSLGKNALVIAKSFHAQNAGSNVTYNNCPLELEREIREVNPVVSLLGTSLAISGKINVSPMLPKEKDLEGNLVFPIAKSTGDVVKYFSKCASIVVSYKKDDLLTKSDNTKFFTFAQLNEWEQLVGESKSDKIAAEKFNKDKKEDEEKVKKVENLNAGHVISTEEVNVGTDFYGSIVSSDVLTEIEKGLLISSLVKMAKKPLGANNSHGRGKVNYEITFGESIIRSEWNEYMSSSTVSVTLDNEAQTYVNSFDEWLESIEEKNIQIGNMLEVLREKK